MLPYLFIVMKTNRITKKIFVGVHLTPDLLKCLNESIVWKNELLERQRDSLEIVRYRDKDYFGTFLPHAITPYLNVKALEPKIREKLFELCPKIKTHHKSIHLFSQTFIA